MFSLSKGLPIAIVRGGSSNGQVIHLIKDLTPEEKLLDDGHRTVTIKDEGKMVPLPNEQNHDTLYVAAPTEAGKTTYLANYIREYMVTFPGKPVIVISSLPEDKPLDDLGVKRINLKDKSLIDKPLSIKELRGKLVVFDDADAIEDPLIRKDMANLLDQVIKIGRIKSAEDMSVLERRYGDIDVLVTSHQIMNYKATREILNEATAITFFPQAGSSYHIEQLLKRYIGLSRDNIERVFALDSRWVTVSKRYPNYILYEKGCYILKREVSKKSLRKVNK